MLVLTRKLMERLYIGDDVCITVVRLEGGQVRLGIEAPRNIAVVRAELVPDRGARRPHVDEGGEELVTRPRASVRGTDIRRREQFR